MSLIVLIITIIVIIILASAVILTITKNNPVESAKEATFKEDVKAFQDDLALTVAKEYTDKQGQRDTKINATGEDVKNYIPNFKDKYVNKFAIVDDTLVGTDKLTEKEKEWSGNLNISISLFNAVEWDKTATPEDCFLWDGDTIIGLNEEKLSDITKIKIPSRCTSIRSDYAFKGTEDYRNLVARIEKVEIPNTVTELGFAAFHNFKNLVNIELPESIIKIGENCFRDCKKLEKIVIPKNLREIELLAFDTCNALTNISFNGTQEQWNSINKNINWNNGSAIKTITCIESDNTKILENSTFNKDEWDKTATPEDCFLWEGDTILGLNEEKLSGVTKIKIPSRCTAIKSKYLYNMTDDYRNFIKSMVGVEIPDTVKEIGDLAFYEWRNLENITIPSSVISIGNDAFSFCNSLKNINFNGTQEQWNNIINKTYYHNQTIICIDAVIKIVYV